MSNGPRTPDVTKAQVIAVISTGLGIATAAGAPINQELQQQIINSVTVLGPTLVAGDAWIRWSRAKHLGDKLMERGQEEKASRLRFEASRVLAFGVGLAVLLGLTGLILAIVK